MQTPYISRGQESIYSQKAFEPNGQVLLKEPLISDIGLNTLLYNHGFLLEQASISGTHGNSFQTITLAFSGLRFNKKGHIKPLVKDNDALNQKITLQMKEVMTLISKKPSYEQAPWIKQFAYSCNDIRFQIEQVHQALLLQTPNFEEELAQKFQSVKYSLMERIFIENYHPGIYFELAPIIHRMAEKVGIEKDKINLWKSNDFKAKLQDDYWKAVDSDKVGLRNKLDFGDLQEDVFIANFKAQLQEEFCMSVATDINNEETKEGISRTKYSKWFSEKVSNGNLPENFSYYDESKSAYYEKLNPPTSDQESLIFNYIAPAEVKHIFDMTGFKQTFSSC